MPSPSPPSKKKTAKESKPYQETRYDNIPRTFANFRRKTEMQNEEL